MPSTLSFCIDIHQFPQFKSVKVDEVLFLDWVQILLVVDFFNNPEHFPQRGYLITYMWPATLHCWRKSVVKIEIRGSEVEVCQY